MGDDKFEIKMKEEFIKRKKEIEEDLVRLLDETESYFSLEDVKDIIYNEEEHDDFMKIVAMFDRGRPEEMGTILEVINDAWNYFPHKALGGKSPQEKMLEQFGNDEKKFTGEISNVKKQAEKQLSDELEKEKKLLEDHFEYAKKHTDEYLNWCFKEVLPNYEKHLKKSKLKKEKIEEALGVADIFLHRCGELGFFDFRRIHPGFFEDFPNSIEIEDTKNKTKLSKNTVKENLNNFLSFLEIYYGIDVNL